MPEVMMPHTLDQLLDLKAASRESAILAGGTDLLVRMRNKTVRPGTLICLDQLRESGIREITDNRDEIGIGAAVTHTGIIKNSVIQQHFPVLIEALNTLGSPQIRNMGTLGGNIVTASPAGDSLPPLYVLDAQVELFGKKGSRRMPVSRFITGPGTTCLDPEEILLKVWIPKFPSYAWQHFEKVGHRRSLSIAIVSMAALVEPAPDGAVKAVRLAWGSVGKTVVTSPETEKQLVGKPLDLAGLTRAADQIRREVSPINDVRAGAGYRRQVAGNLLLRLFSGSVEQKGRGCK